MFRVGIHGVGALATFAGKTCYADNDSTLKPKLVLLKTSIFTPPPYQKELNSSTLPLKGRVEHKKLDFYEILKISGQESRAKIVLGTTIGLVAGSYFSNDVLVGSLFGSAYILGRMSDNIGVLLTENHPSKPISTYNKTPNFDVPKDIKKIYFAGKSKINHSVLESTLGAPLCEEIFCRWLLQGQILPNIINALALTPLYYTPAIAIGISAVFFGALHLLRGTEEQAMNATITGVFLGILYNGNGLPASIAMHSINNTFIEGLYGLFQVEKFSSVVAAVNDQIGSPHIDKASKEVAEQNIIKLGYAILKDPECFILLLMLITFNKDLLKEEKQQLRSKLIDLLPKDPELRSIVENMLYDKIYDSIKDEIDVSSITRSIPKREDHLSVLTEHITSQLLADCGFEKEEIEEIIFIALEKQLHFSKELVGLIYRE